MQKFDYRVPRFLVDLPVRLDIGDSVHPCRCREISSEGMRLEIDEPLLADSIGIVRMGFESLAFELRFRITHVKPNVAGLRFVYESDRQRNDVDRLITLLTASARTTISGPLLLG